MRLDVKGVSKVFRNGGQERSVLEDVSFTIGEGEFVTLLGPSGCGKTTLLTIIAGFQSPSSGEVRLNGAPVSKPGPDRAFVFQDYALFPWMTVRQNVLYPLKQRKVPQEEQERRLRELLTVAHLEGFENLHPHQISGGMKQRTAMIRALACDPQVLLMDEPLGAVDHQMRQILQEELEAIWLKARTTVVMVTHDVDEAIVLSDRVIVMSARRGRIMEDLSISMERPRVRRGDPFHAIRDRLMETLRWALSEGSREDNPSDVPLAMRPVLETE